MTRQAHRSLRALYTTNQQSQMQLSEMRTSVMKTLTP